MKSPESSIPEKCLNCPSIFFFQDHIDTHKEKVERLIDLAMSDEVERVVTVLSKYLEENEPELVADENVTPEEIIRQFRSKKGEELELEDEAIEMHQAEMADFVKDCLGSLKLRGSRDGRRVVTTEVCMSPRLDDGDYTELTNVNRKII